MDCYYHPKNPLLNFCMNPSCSLPLCPKCINVHLSQSSNHHQIVSISQAQQQVINQVDITLTGLVQQYKSLRQQYSPNNVINDYAGMIQKYRQEAIDQINQHYDYLHRELQAEISARYSQHLQKLILPVEEQITFLEKTQNGLKNHQKSIQTLIIVVSQNSLQNASELVLNIKQKKKQFKGQLPRLQDGERGRLKMTSQKVVVGTERMVSPTFNPLPSYHQTVNRSPTSVPIHQVQGPLASLNRIAELQARLLSLKHQ